MRCAAALLTLVICLLTAPNASAQTSPADALPDWIWANPNAAPNETVYLRSTVTLAKNPRTAVMHALVDGDLTLYINGREVASATGRATPTSRELSRFFKPGQNTLAIRATNDATPSAAVALKFDIVLPGFVQDWARTDATWRTSTTEQPDWFTPGFDDSAWRNAHGFGSLTDDSHPFGDGGMGSDATDPADIDTPEHFAIELVRSSLPGEGSWISIAFDPQGRITLGVERAGALRLTLNDTGAVTRVEPLANFPGEARGLLYAYDSLYANVSDYANNRNGVYRLRDTDGDDQYDDVQHLFEIKGGPGHGRNSLRLGPDGLIYVICGDSTRFPTQLKPDSKSPYRFTGDGYMPDRPYTQPGSRPRLDAIGPGGYLARFDRDGQNIQLIAAGLRNPYDIDFNADGEIFTFDADMEPDAGTPWYRPTRVYHLVDGGEFGWRKGVGQWPAYYPDMTPPVIDIGLSSPTGIVFGTRARFPQKYRDALYLADWSYGKIIAVYPTPRGSSYTAIFEDFITGRPFNTTDVEIGPDGHMYITTGGRGTQSGLYRVRYTGTIKPDPEPVLTSLPKTSLRDMRRGLERRITERGYTPEGWPTEYKGPLRDDTPLRHTLRLMLEHRMTPAEADRTLNDARPDNLELTLLPLVRTAKDT
ncbi:MAG: PQQ-dependent sugar dehydrogenase, partial [Planctomycetota bacterium]